MEFNKEEKEKFEIMAELLKVLAHPVRLCIIRGLIQRGECNVGHMQNCLGLPQSTISQHLAKLRSGGIIKGRRDGVEVFYTVANKAAEEIVRILLQVF